jgi:hypothetical protein
VSRDDNDRKPRARAIQRLLDFPTRHVRHLEVKYQTIGPIKMPAIEKFRAGSEGAYGKACRLQEADERFTNRVFVVDDCNQVILAIWLLIALGLIPDL